MARPDRVGVCLPDGETGSSLFQRLLCEAADRWPGVLGSTDLPRSAGAFRTGYADALVRFEHARQAAPERSEIARFIVEAGRDAFSLVAEGVERPLDEALNDPGEPLELLCTPLSGNARLTPQVPYHDRVFRSDAIRDLAARLLDEDRATTPVVEAVDWLLDHALDEAGEIDLQGRRCVVIGAGAEIAPTQLLLEAGADVLFLDAHSPPESLVKDSTLSGRLFVPAEPVDLLVDPCAVAATVRAFAAQGPLDVFLYAYAPGRGREWRLTATMNAIVDSLPAECLASVGVLVSPTTPVALRPETLAASDRRHAERPSWQAALEGAGLLGKAHVGEGDTRLLRNVVSVQGPGYQAAQYVGKVLAVERWATAGPAGRGLPVALSCNVAAITMTRSLRHPVFEAGFVGASAFHVETLEPETTRNLNGLLTIHDLLNPRPAEVGELFAQQVHGGLFALPYALEPAIRVGAVIGLARRPGLIPGFVRSLLGR